MPAIFPSFSAKTLRAASRSLNGTTRTRSANACGMPIACGTVFGCSRGPMSAGSGATENISESWCPWYEPSIFTSMSRPVFARIRRPASSVASVPELANRHSGSLNRSARFSPITSRCFVGWAKWVPSSAWRWIASTIFGCACPTTMAP